MRCGGGVWTDGLIPFEIIDEDLSGDGLSYSDTGLDAYLLEHFRNWQDATYGVLKLVRCLNDDCAAANYQKWLTVKEMSGGTRCRSGTGPGGTTLAVNANRFGNPPTEKSSWEMLPHEFGHCVGLPHVFIRSDRDAFVDFHSAACDVGSFRSKCHSDGPAGGFGDPDRPTGFFGPYDALSKMNYRSNALCEEPGVGFEPDRDLLPSFGDASAAIELQQSLHRWAPFYPPGF